MIVLVRTHGEGCPSLCAGLGVSIYILAFSVCFSLGQFAFLRRQGEERGLLFVKPASCLCERWSSRETWFVGRYE